MLLHCGLAQGLSISQLSALGNSGFTPLSTHFHLESHKIKAGTPAIPRDPSSRSHGNLHNRVDEEGNGNTVFCPEGAK